MDNKFVVKDSGVREEYESGMRRDTQEGKPDYTLIHIPFLTRIANHLVKGAKKYGENNWQLANSPAELKRFRKSAFRHLIQWLNNEQDEDHMAAVCFNLMAAEYVKEKLSSEDNHNDGIGLCTIFWDNGAWLITTYEEMYNLKPEIAKHIEYFVDGALVFHTLPGKENNLS